MSILAKPAPPPPAFADLDKPTKDLFGKEFYHQNPYALEVRLKTPNGAAVTAKGTPLKDGLSTSLEGKQPITKGVIATITSATSKAQTTVTGKAEFEDIAAPGLKAEATAKYNQAAKSAKPEFAITYKQPFFNARGHFAPNDASPSLATFNCTFGQDGALVGGEVGYDVTKGAITTYNLGFGYRSPLYSATVLAQNRVSQIQATYYQRVNPALEVGLKSVYNLSSQTSALVEMAAKYQIDPLTFAKGKIDNHGIACLSYNTRVNKGLTLGLGASFDTTKLNEPAHKFGASFIFEG